MGCRQECSRAWRGRVPRWRDSPPLCQPVGAGVRPVRCSGKAGGCPLFFLLRVHREAPDLRGKHEHAHRPRRLAVPCAAESLRHMLKTGPGAWSLLGGLWPPFGAPIPLPCPSRWPEPLSLGPGRSHWSPTALFLFGAHCRMPKWPEQRDGQPGVAAAAERLARRPALSSSPAPGESWTLWQPPAHCSAAHP